jgi:adenine-specific DNA methylase
VTDPPYYDAIPYSDLMDFFYVWLRRTLHEASPEIDAAFSDPLSPNGTERPMTVNWSMMLHASAVTRRRPSSTMKTEWRGPSPLAMRR